MLPVTENKIYISFGQNTNHDLEDIKVILKQEIKHGMIKLDNIILIYSYFPYKVLFFNKSIYFHLYHNNLPTIPIVKVKQRTKTAMHCIFCCFTVTFTVIKS